MLPDSYISIVLKTAVIIARALFVFKNLSYNNMLHVTVLKKANCHLCAVYLIDTICEGS